MDQGRFSDAWDDIQRPQIPHYQGRAGPSNFPLEQARLQQNFDGNSEVVKLFIIIMIRSLLFNLRLVDSCLLSCW